MAQAPEEDPRLRVSISSSDRGVDVMTVDGSVDVSVEEQRVLLGARHPGWRIGRGGSGRWWAVRGADHVWGATPDELEAQLTRHAS